MGRAGHGQGQGMGRAGHGPGQGMAGGRAWTAIMYGIRKVLEYYLLNALENAR